MCKNTKNQEKEYKEDYKTADKAWYSPHNPALSGKTIVGFKKLVSTAVLPEYKNVDDAGMDLRSVSFYDIAPGDVQLVETGLAIQLKSGLEAQVRPRSGLAAKHGVTVLNSPGTIDAGYRGEIKVILINHGKNHFIINKGDRIAQIVIAAVEQPKIVEIHELDQTFRGVGGFGSTGTK